PVQLLHLRVQGAQRIVRGCTFAQQHDTLDHVLVVHDRAVLAADRAADLAETDLRPLGHHRDITHADGRAALALQNGGADVVDAPHDPDAAHLKALLAAIAEAAASAGIVL